MELKVPLISFACCRWINRSHFFRRVTSATLPIPSSSFSPPSPNAPPPAPVPPLSSDWNLETHLLPHSLSQLQPCQVVCTRLPFLSSLPFSPLTALSFLSLSSRRLLQALWRICPNYLSYWRLCVNKPKNCRFFSMPPSFPFSFLQPHLDAISSHFGPSFWSFLSHHIFLQFFFCLPSTSKSPPLVKGHYFFLPSEQSCDSSQRGKQVRWWRRFNMQRNKTSTTCHFAPWALWIRNCNLSCFAPFTLSSLGW